MMKLGTGYRWHKVLLSIGSLHLSVSNDWGCLSLRLNVFRKGFNLRVFAGQDLPNWFSVDRNLDGSFHVLRIFNGSVSLGVWL